MNDLMWYFPESLDEAMGLMGQDRVVPYAGGTSIIRQGVERYRGFIHLGKLPLNYFKCEAGFIEVGAMRTLSDVVRDITAVGSGSIIEKSFSRAASPPLRNLITVGGSIVSFPMWSDVMGPLIALGSEVSFAGDDEWIPIVDFARDKATGSGKILRAVRFRDENWRSYYFRATRTYFDYPNFTITLLAKKSPDEVIEDIRIVIIGSREKFTELCGLEEYIKGKTPSDIDFTGLGDLFEVDFPPKRLGGSEYIKQICAVELERGLREVLR